MGDEKPIVKMVTNEPPQQVDDDWFVLLDVASKSAGIYCVDFAVRRNQIEMEMLRAVCVYSSLVTMEQRVYPDVQPVKEFSPKEQKLQQGMTVETETWKQGKVFKSLPAVREVEDDWYIHLDVAAKKSGRS